MNSFIDAKTMNAMIRLSVFAGGAMVLSACALSIQEVDPQWRIPIHRQKPCESIDGRYMDRGNLFDLLGDSSKNTVGTRFSTSRGLKPLPYGGLPFKEFIEKRRSFNDAAITEIVTTKDELEVSLRGGDGEVYATTIISINSDRVGCDAKNHLVLRQFSIASGSEGTGGSATAIETTIYPSPDGALKVRRLSRTWFKSMNSSPREKESDQIFPAAPN
ncbi:hypothetical protein [Variovorax sp. HW608]|uniref:hypothetical protein n=1 Tax=Variovorax sp. HW608 TaxID=1034889 RepID=UPI0012FE10E0|nr:hypothetical protein [Variovorax sp. HW608]